MTKEEQALLEKLREKLIDLIYDELGGDSEFDIEGGFFPTRDRTEEIVDDGIIRLAHKYNLWR